MSTRPCFSVRTARAARRRAAARFAGFAIAVATAGGCTSSLLTNLVTNVDGNISVQIINETDFRGSLTIGTYDSLDRSPPGPASIQQFRVEARSSSAATNLTCARNCAIGTAELVRRVVDLELDKSSAGFDLEAFDTTVHFSDAPADSPLASAPLAGTAEGVMKRLGVEYSCGDELIFTLRQDPDAPGGFRVDYQVIQN